MRYRPSRWRSALKPRALHGNGERVGHTRTIDPAGLFRGRLGIAAPAVAAPGDGGITRQWPPTALPAPCLRGEYSPWASRIKSTAHFSCFLAFVIEPLGCMHVVHRGTIAAIPAGAIYSPPTALPAPCLRGEYSALAQKIRLTRKCT